MAVGFCEVMAKMLFTQRRKKTQKAVFDLHYFAALAALREKYIDL